MLKMDLEYRKFKRYKREILFVRLKGNLNKRSVYKIHNYLVPVLKKHKIENLIYNFKYLDSIDESGINALILTKCLVKNYKGNIFICNVRRELESKLRRLRIKTFSSETRIMKNFGAKNEL